MSIKWEKVVKIEEIESSSKYVYDFSVPYVENFANMNGIFVHNTVESKLLGWITETFRFKQFIVIICVPDLSMINSRVRKCTHAFVRMYGRNGEEGRVYKLVSTHLGSQFLKGIGVMRNIVLPNYEDCKRSSCRKCNSYKTCSLLRGEYERKKEEAFNELLAFTQFRIGQLSAERALASSPYGFRERMQTESERENWGEDIVPVNDEDEEENE